MGINSLPESEWKRCRSVVTRILATIREKEIYIMGMRGRGGALDLLRPIQLSIPSRLEGLKKENNSGPQVIHVIFSKQCNFIVKTNSQLHQLPA